MLGNRSRETEVDKIQKKETNANFKKNKRSVYLNNARYVKSAEKPILFVSMSFKKKMEDTFYFGIQESAKKSGFICQRLDYEIFTGDIIKQLKTNIEKSNGLIADLTGSNPNVYLEVGYAWGSNIPTILLVKDGGKIEFNLRNHRHLKYKTIRDLQESLTKELKNLKLKNR